MLSLSTVLGRERPESKDFIITFMKVYYKMFHVVRDPDNTFIYGWEKNAIKK